MPRPASQHPSWEDGVDDPAVAQTNRISRNRMLRFEITNQSRHWTLVPDGEIDLSNADVLEQAIRQVEASAAETITIDLRRMRFIDLSGVRAIVDDDARLEGWLRLIKGPAAVQSVFHLTGAEAALPFEG